ncbi:MAG: hypothetical protein OHK0046_33180 [Anaerolineae bacterium]
MQEQQFEDVQFAIDAGDKAEARRLLASLLTSQPSAEAWMLAARAMETDEQTVVALKKVLEYDPQHPTANQLLAVLNAGNADAVLAEKSGAALLAYLGMGGDGATGGARSVTPSGTNQMNPTPQRPQKPRVDPNAEGVYEMLWDCQNCGSTKLLGKTHKFCPHCGTPQDPNWRYFPSDEDKVAVHEHEYVGADRTCANCGTLNSAASDFCQRCGAPLDNAAAAKLRGRREKADGEGFAGEDLLERLHAERDAAVGRGALAQSASAKKGGPNIRVLAIIGVVLAVIVGAIFFFTRTEQKTVTLVDYRWERTVNVERLNPVQGSSDCGAEPAGAYGIDRRYEQVGSRQVPDGETCRNVQVDQGDGTFRQERQCETRYRSEPVMGYVCYYTVNVWQQQRTSEATGNKSQAIIWPETNIRQNCITIGCEREGQRNERYIFILQSGQDRYECAVPFEQWDSTPIERAFTLEVNAVSNSPQCSSLTPA